MWNTNYEAVSGLSIKDIVVNKKNTVFFLGDTQIKKSASGEVNKN